MGTGALHRIGDKLSRKKHIDASADDDAPNTGSTVPGFTDLGPGLGSASGAAPRTPPERSSDSGRGLIPLIFASPHAGDNPPRACVRDSDGVEEQFGQQSALASSLDGVADEGSSQIQSSDPPQQEQTVSDSSPLPRSKSSSPAFAAMPLPSARHDSTIGSLMSIDENKPMEVLTNTHRDAAPVSESTDNPSWATKYHPPGSGRDTARATRADAKTESTSTSRTGSQASPLVAENPVGMATTRKIWVRRPGASATMVTINEHDIVDDVRNCILRKYANSLGRYYDSPDLNLRIGTRDDSERLESLGNQLHDRVLGPEEPMCAILDVYFPGGQLSSEAVVIDIPAESLRASARFSPAMNFNGIQPTIFYTAAADGRPSEAGETYFPSVGTVPAIATMQVPHLYSHPHQTSYHQQQQQPHYHHQQHHQQYHQQYHPSHYQPLSHISTGLHGSAHARPPSPGGGNLSRSSRTYRDRSERPRTGRTHLSPPTSVISPPSVIASGQPNYVGHPSVIGARQQGFGGLGVTGAQIGDTGVDAITRRQPSLDKGLDDNHVILTVGAPSAEPMSLRGGINARMQSKRIKGQATADSLTPLPPTSGSLIGVVPPINVLIVEDNPVNLKLLEAFVKGLRMRWNSASNGRDAVAKWREGGFHLILMDIQLPVMTGLDATREIRRLERINSIGKFSSPPLPGTEDPPDQIADEDKLAHFDDDNVDGVDKFKTPVIIVALTASSLQSDRHEALAAGCNDFLTKPVKFDWLERKVTEWGCMQALIDFEGWRRWKILLEESETRASKAAAKGKAKANR